MQLGCASNCSTMSDTQEFAIGREEGEHNTPIASSYWHRAIRIAHRSLATLTLVRALAAIYFYEPEGRGACRPFEGTKIFVTWFRSYLVVVSEDPNSKQHQANIYDLANQVRIRPSIRTISLNVWFCAVQRVQSGVSECDACCVGVGSDLPLLRRRQAVSSGGLFDALRFVLFCFPRRPHGRFAQEKDTQTKLETLFMRKVGHVCA